MRGGVGVPAAMGLSLPNRIITAARALPINPPAARPAPSARPRLSVFLRVKVCVKDANSVFHVALIRLLIIAPCSSNSSNQIALGALLRG
jgi:hypothetical protein